jgi:hypothetical protein
MYVRFVTDLIDKKSKERLGVIRAAAFCQSNNQFSKEDEESLNEIFDWFNDFLLVPRKFNKAKSGKRAISWFKDSASVCIGKARDIGNILEKYGYNVEMLLSRNPG